MGGVELPNYNPAAGEDFDDEEEFAWLGMQTVARIVEIAAGSTLNSDIEVVDFEDPVYWTAVFNWIVGEIVDPVLHFNWKTTTSVLGFIFFEAWSEAGGALADAE